MTKAKPFEPVVDALGEAERSKKTVLEILNARTKGADRAIVFRAVSERIRTCMLDPREAAIIASWFDQLAEGTAPADVFFGERRGRKRGSTGTKFIRGNEVKLPDHFDLSWNMRRAFAAGHSESSVFDAVAKVYGVTSEYVEEIWNKWAPELAPDPDIPE